MCSQLLGPNELKRLHPYLNTEDLAGAAWVPGDATCNPKAICQTLASLSIKGGEWFFFCHLLHMFPQPAATLLMYTSCLLLPSLPTKKHQ